MQNPERAYSRGQHFVSLGTKIAGTGLLTEAMGIPASSINQDVTHALWIAGSLPTIVGGLLIRKGCQLMWDNMPPSTDPNQPDDDIEGGAIIIDLASRFDQSNLPKAA